MRGCSEVTIYYACGSVSVGGFRSEPQCSETTIEICWDDSGNGGDGGDGGNGDDGNGDDGCSWCDELSDNWNVGVLDGTTVIPFVLINRPCVSSLTQGFTTAGVLSTLYQGTMNSGSTLNGQWLRTTEGNFIDIIVPITNPNTGTTNQIFIGAFSLNISGIQPSVNGVPVNRLSTPTQFSQTELNTISTLASNAYVASLTAYANGQRSTNTGNQSVDFLSLWAQIFDQSTSNYRMNAESGDLNASTARGTRVSSCP